MATTLHGATAVTVRPTHAAPRQDLRSHGEQFADRLFGAINEAAHRHRPIPGGAITKDLLRGRSVSVITVGSVLAALALNDPTDVAMIFASLSAWLHGVRPTALDSLKAHAQRESAEQGDADAAVWAASDAVERRDIGALERAIKETSEHIVAAQQLLSVLEAQLASVMPSRRKYRVVAFDRTVAARA